MCFACVLGLLLDQSYDLPCSNDLYMAAAECNNLGIPAPQVLFALKTWLPNKKIAVLYRATRDGFSSFKFHEKCDNKGPTLTVIRSNNDYLFGGYTPQPWISGDEVRLISSPDTFIFTLLNPYNIPPTFFLPQDTSAGIICYKGCEANFGSISKTDIHVGSTNNDSYTRFSAFKDTTGKGYTLFTGSGYFSPKEVTVYSIFSDIE